MTTASAMQETVGRALGMPKGAKLRCDLGVGDSIGQVIIWILLTIVTLGLALFVFYYYYLKYAINKTVIVDLDNRQLGKLVCEVDLSGAIGNAVLWVFLTIITLGLAGYIYIYRASAYTLSKTRIEMF